jgi:hypothetical protein
LIIGASSLNKPRRKQILAFLKSIFQDIEGDRSPRLLFGESQALPIIFNSMIKVELITAVNFRPAVLCQGDIAETWKNPLGTMVTYYNETLDRSYKWVNAFGMLSKDYNENY